MKDLMENLLALQTIEFQNATFSAAQEKERTRLREKIPAPILGHYQRLLDRNKKAVSVVQNGVCSACHIKIAVGILGALAFGNDIQLCGNCGRYLYLPENEPVVPSDLTPVEKSSRKRVRSAGKLS